jgi:transglutaminase-like putative cysteine protease
MGTRTVVVIRLPAMKSLDDPTPRTLVLDQRIRYRYSAPVTNLRQRLRVVPPSAHGPHRRRRWRLSVEGAQPSRTRAFLDRFGNVTVDVTLPRVEDEVTFVLDVEARTDRSGHRATIVEPEYLRPTRLTEPDDAIRELAWADGRSNTQSICDRVHRALVYEWGVTGVRTTASEAVAGGRGVCQDFAHVMLAACRLVGKPARYVSGHLIGEGGSHAWVEILLPDPQCPGSWIAKGWDPTHNRRTNSSYLAVAVGRDYADAAPLSGTYDGEGASNTLAVNKRLELV